MESTKPKDQYPIFKEEYLIKSGFYSGSTLQPVSQIKDDLFEFKVFVREIGFVKFIDGFANKKGRKEIAVVKLSVAEFNKWINGD